MLIINAKIYTMSEKGIIENGYVRTENGKIAEVDSMSELKSTNENTFGRQRSDLVRRDLPRESRGRGICLIGGRYGQCCPYLLQS